MNTKINERKLVYAVIASLPQRFVFNMPLILEKALEKHSYGHLLGKKKVNKLKATIYYAITYLIKKGEIVRAGREDGFNLYRKIADVDEGIN